MAFRLLLLGFWSLSFLSAADRIIDNNAHLWFAYFGDHPIGKSRWGVHLEGQVRRHDFGLTWQQLLLRPGVNFSVNRVLTLTAGYTLSRSHSYSDFTTPRPAVNEHRLWEQAWFRYGKEPLRWSTRIRLENRFLATPVTGGPTTYRYENRLRTWQQVTKRLTERVYLTGYDEVWLYVKPYTSNSFFDQNRAYAALGFRVKPSLRFEIAYNNQTILQRTGRVVEVNHTLVLTFFSNKRFSL